MLYFCITVLDKTFYKHILERVIFGIYPVTGLFVQLHYSLNSCPGNSFADSDHQNISFAHNNRFVPLVWTIVLRAKFHSFQRIKPYEFSMGRMSYTYWSDAKFIRRNDTGSTVELAIMGTGVRGPLEIKVSVVWEFRKISLLVNTWGMCIHPLRNTRFSFTL